MITRQEALNYLQKKIAKPNILKHLLATECLMGGIYDYLASQGKKELGGSKEEWMMAGLLHDGDYIPTVPDNLQGVEITKWLRKDGFLLPENIANAMAAHNWENTQVKPQSLMDWTLYCGDSLTGLLVACALVMPSKKLSEVNLNSVLKKFNNQSFASGTRRGSIALCQENIGIPLEKFIEISLLSLQQISSDLGL